MQALGKAVTYCGDGINDLAALTVANVGMAISSSNAAATSVTGLLLWQVHPYPVHRFNCCFDCGFVLPSAARNTILDASVTLAEATVAMLSTTPA